MTESENNNETTNEMQELPEKNKIDITRELWYVSKNYTFTYSDPLLKKMDIYIFDLGNNIKLGYISVNKSASQNIRNYCRDLFGNRTRLYIETPNSRNDLELEGITLFSIVRNPWERFHSTFNMIWKNNSLNEPETFKKFCENPDKCGVSSRGPEHWRSQRNLLICKNGDFLPKYVGYINRLEDDILTIVSKLIPKNLSKKFYDKAAELKKKNFQHHHRSKEFDNPLYYMKYYTDTISLDNVTSYTHEDIDLFNFKFDKA